MGTLNAEGGLEMLGKVVAGDLFNGNSDRFFPGTNKDLKCGPFNVRLKTLVNPGNAMIIATQGGFTVSMLDYVDPQSRFKNINESLAAAEKDGEWPGRTLAGKTKRHKFAKEIIEDLEAVLHPKKSMFSMKTKLGRDSVKRLEKGMMEGARLIKSRLEMKFNPNRWTPGAKERYMVVFKV